MAEGTTIIDEEKTMLRLRLSNLEDTITHLQYIKAQTAASHQHEVGKLQARIDVLERELSSGGKDRETLEQGFGKRLMMAEQQGDTICNIRNGENLTNVKNNDDIVMFGCDNGAGSMDLAGVDELEGDGKLHGGYDVMGDSDEDTSSEGAPGPAAWLTFQAETRILRISLNRNPDLALQHKRPHQWNPLQGGLFDLVPGVSKQSNTYFVPKDVVESALRDSDSYLEYSATLFDSFIKVDVALLCTWGDYTNENVDDGHVRASLPPEAMSVFLEHCSSMALHYFKATLGEPDLKLQLKQFINKHINNLRDVHKLGPSEEQYEDYKRAMRRDRRWALIDLS